MPTESVSAQAEIRTPSWNASLALRVLAFATVCAASSAAAQSYPVKPVRLIVPFAPGGSADIVARMIAQPLSARWGVQLIVDNRGGAGGNLAGEIAANAPGDGYTAFQINVANTIAVSMHDTLKYDPVRDFAAVTQLAASPFVLVTTITLNVKSAQDLIALAKAKPGQISYGSSGNGGASHLLMESLKSLTGMTLVHVPYNSGPTLHTDLVAGRIQATLATPAATMAYVRAGKLRGLGIASRQRSALAPELPTLTESGAPGFEGGTWFGLVVPARAPRPIVAKLNDDVVQVLKQPELRDRMIAQGVEPSGGSTPETFAAFIKSEIERWHRIVAASGVRSS